MNSEVQENNLNNRHDQPAHGGPTDKLPDLTVVEEQEVQVRGGDGAATTVPVKIGRPGK